METITKELVTKLIDTVTPGLCAGVGKPEPGQMCVEAAVCYAYGLPHGDNPPCVGGAVRSYKIKLNDASWSSNQARAKGMLALSIAQLNSVEIDQKEFSKRIVLKTINTIVADLAKKYLPEKEQAFRDVADLDDAKELCHELRRAADAAYAAAYAADAAYAAAYAADAAYAAADAAYAAADVAYAAAERDKVLNQAAQNCLEVLIEMKSPGVEFLYLIEA